jgi:hypothetical protein
MTKILLQHLSCESQDAIQHCLNKSVYVVTMEESERGSDNNNNPNLSIHDNMCQTAEQELH